MLSRDSRYRVKLNHIGSGMVMRGAEAAPRTTPRPSLRTTTHGFQTVGGGAKRSRASTATGNVTGHGVAPFGNNRRPCLKQPEAAAHNNARLPNRPPLRESVAAPGLCKPAQWTGCCTIRKQQAAMLEPSETGRASTVASEVNGQGVAPLSNNSAETAGGCGHAVPPAAGGVLHHLETTVLCLRRRRRPCLKQPEAAAMLCLRRRRRLASVY
jgi:hypothetical protein